MAGAALCAWAVPLRKQQQRRMDASRSLLLQDIIGSEDQQRYAGGSDSCEHFVCVMYISTCEARHEAQPGCICGELGFLGRARAAVNRQLHASGEKPRVPLLLLRCCHGQHCITMTVAAMQISLPLQFISSQRRFSFC